MNENEISKINNDYIAYKKNLEIYKNDVEQIKKEIELLETDKTIAEAKLKKAQIKKDNNEINIAKKELNDVKKGIDEKNKDLQNKEYYVRDEQRKIDEQINRLKSDPALKQQIDNAILTRLNRQKSKVDKEKNDKEKQKNDLNKSKSDIQNLKKILNEPSNKDLLDSFRGMMSAKKSINILKGELGKLKQPDGSYAIDQVRADEIINKLLPKAENRLKTNKQKCMDCIQKLGIGIDEKLLDEMTSKKYEKDKKNKIDVNKVFDAEISGIDKKVSKIDKNIRNIDKRINKIDDEIIKNGGKIAKTKSKVNMGKYDILKDVTGINGKKPTPAPTIAPTQPTIVYNGKDNTYSINFLKNPPTVEKAKKLYTRKAKIDFIKKMGSGDLNIIFGSDYENKIKKLAKNIDAQLLEILDKEDPKYAKAYIEQLEKGEKAIGTKLPYSMTYDLKEMTTNKKNNNLKSWITRSSISRLAKANADKNVAICKKDDKLFKLPVIGVIAGMAAGALAIGGIAGLSKTDSDQLTLGDSSTTLGDSDKNVNNRNEEVSDKTNKNNVNGIDFSDIDINGYTITAEAATMENEEPKTMSLGDKLYLENGIVYAKDIYGTGENKIGGPSWIPAGEYTANKVSFQYGDGKEVTFSDVGLNIDEKVEEFAKELGMDPSEIVIHVHVCQYDNNGGAVGWLEKDYNELKEIVAEKYNPEKDAQKNTQKNTRADSEVVRNDNEPTR